MTAPRLGAWAGFAAVLSAAGLPIYIHAPKVYVDSYGVGLAALGAMLFALRLIDVVQDPLLGRLAAWSRSWRSLSVGIAAAVLCVGMLGLFAVVPPIAPLWWFGLTLMAVFSAFSFLTIVFYASGVAKAAALDGPTGHIRLARWRESGALLGVCLAAMAPTVIASLELPAFPVFAVVFALATCLAVLGMRGQWTTGVPQSQSGFGPVLRDAQARRLLVLALVNSAPVAVSSTLFLFFVESRLQAPGWEGPLLLLFFLAAALAAPLWGFLAERHGVRTVLLAAMLLSILAFAGALLLGTGDVVLFALVCLGSGAALGADMTLLPAVFSARLARIAPGATEGFALWSFVSKFTLAFAAVALLPVLEMQGYRSGSENGEAALWSLSLLYAGLPCLLKLLAIALLVTTKIEEPD